MQDPNNSSLILPLTPLKLNYYLSQCKRAKSGHKTNINVHFNNMLSKVQHDNNIFTHSPTNYFVDQSKATSNLSARVRRDFNGQMFNEDYKNISKRYDAESSNDALDSFMAVKQCQFKENFSPIKQQRYTDRPALHKYLNEHISDNRSMYQLDAKTERIPLSNSNLNCQNNILDTYNNASINNFNQNASIQFFDHHKSEMTDIKLRKKVNWKTDHGRPQRRTKYYPDLENSFSEISKELTKINYQLHQNSKKLNQMNKLYPTQKSNPQDSIRRANLKYAVVEQPCTYNSPRPRIQYNDREYKDPKCIMWQPSHRS